MVMIASTVTDYEARILEEEGISVHLSGEHSATERVQVLGWVALMVLQKDAKRARETLVKAKQAATDMNWDKVDFGIPGSLSNENEPAPPGDRYRGRSRTIIEGRP